MPDRENVINELVEHIESALDIDSDYVDCVRTDLLQYALSMLKEQPEIVRCKDCRYKGNQYECRLDSDLLEHGGYRTEEYDDWFCADGERKYDNDRISTLDSRRDA